MFKTVTEFIIDREALMKCEFGCFDKVSITDGADYTDIAPAEIIASILAELIDKEAEL